MSQYDDSRKVGEGLNLPKIETIGASVDDLVVVRSGARSSLSRYSPVDYHGEIHASPKRIEGKPPVESKKQKKSKASVEADALLKFALAGNRIRESELSLAERDALLNLKGIAIRRVVLNGERWIVHMKP